MVESRSKLVSGPESQPEIGNTLPLSRVPLGTVISCELRPGQGCCARSAGTFAQLMAEMEIRCYNQNAFR
jgi:large subunit ribosomal protein L2